MIDTREIVEVKFESSLRGYSKKEVDHFLQDLTDKINEENDRFAELEKKCSALKLRVEDVLAQAEEERAERDALRAEAEAVLADARVQAEEILKNAREEEKQGALRARFDAEKAVAAAKREAIVLSEESRAKAKAVELASHRAADRVIGDAKTKAAAILREAEQKSEELLMNARASVESERILFGQLKGEISSKSAELSRLLNSQLADVAAFAARVESTSFGQIPADREELLAKYAHADPEEAAVQDRPSYDEDESVLPPKSEKASEEEAEAPTAYSDPNSYNGNTDTDEDVDRSVYLASPRDDDGYVNDGGYRDVDEYTDVDEDTYVDETEEDDDTYGYEGDGGDVLTAEFDGLPQTKDQLSDINTSRALTDEELDRIFSFDVEQILSEEE